jgi:isochorismate pyruvate lyase
MVDKGLETMDPKRPWECADMSQVRSEIDRIDAALVDLIAERYGYVDRAWQLKISTQEGAVVQWRIQQVIDRVKARAADKNMPPEMIDMVGAQWRNMIGWFVQFEEEKLRQAQEAAKAKSGENGSA